MPSTQEPCVIEDPPQAIIQLAQTNPSITLNQRADRWTKERLAELKKDRVWQINMALYHGIWMSSELTDFLNELRGGDTIVACVQDTMGDIFTVVGSVKEVFWTAYYNMTLKPRGVHASIRFKGGHRYGTDGVQLWGNYILAISKVKSSARKTSRKDPDGCHFISLFEAYKIQH